MNNNETNAEVVYLHLDDIIPNRFQPREVFDERALKELAISIKEHGVIQPIIVRSVNGKYEIIAGERRYKATALAGLTKIPAIIRNLDDKESSKVALLENLQRKNLNPIEEARTYQKILELDEMTQDELAKTMGKSQSAVANKIRLLSLPDDIQELLLKEQISERHARALLNIPDSKKQKEMVKKVITNKMTVRALEEEISRLYPKNNNDQESGDNGGMVNMQQIINYGEINNNDLLEEPKNSYFTNEQFNPVSVENIKEQATDITLPSSTNVPGGLDDLLNIQGTPNINSNQFSAAAAINDSNNLIDNTINKKDYFASPDLTQSQERFMPADVQTVSPVDNNQNSIFNIPTPIMGTNSSTNYTIQQAISKIRELVKELELNGIKINIDEMDFPNAYQVIIKVDKTEN